ncbi:OmpP1/FadL family transporter [Yoonia sediminilitoris]|uniref:Long-subunit fatty acid transport protein n=1 Tax=Yoonia sediminilitoris TaxID=1286148 RepID=A0A2T6KS22_9RHOB|nr:outer membrane protein transport protein [Yoonia sediminilitoris]PUB19370.1 long-subunit fatty acid transport protein [Yoonia sediminilitoris]RCW99538.1 long-subunit fatty acid transport protein [Yoonia sediminilitoris]
MNKVLTGGAALLLTTSMAHAVGLDRSGQSVGVLFEDGNYAELSYGYVSPDVTGNDIGFGESDTGNVAEAYDQLGLGYKRDIDSQFSFALIFDEPYGANIDYPDDGSVLISPTAAELNSVALTGLLRYKFDENFSVHGGLRGQRLDADIVLPNGTPVELDYSTAFGYVIGGAYERPEIALRVALTYFSEIEHTFDTTTAGVFQEELEVKTPQAVNLDFQTGIATDTLLFGSVRWAEYSVVEVIPTPVGESITDIDDGFSYSLGVGRRFTDEFSASISATLDTEGDDDLVSPLSPTNGSSSIGLGGQYQVNDNVTLSGGVRYIMLGDANAAPSDVPLVEFKDNNAVAVGFKIGYDF